MKHSPIDTKCKHFRLCNGTRKGMWLHCALGKGLYCNIQASYCKHREREDMTDIKQLEERLQQLNKDFEEYKKQKSDKRWKPELRELYYFITSYGSIDYAYWENDKQDKFRYSQGNCFQTYEQADHHLECLKTKAELQALADELNGDREIDWNDRDKDKYCLVYEQITNRICSGIDSLSKVQGSIYFIDSDSINVAKDRIGEQRLIEMIKEGV